MGVAGIILLLIGFALVIPRGAITGSVAARNVPVGTSHIDRTPGYQEAPQGRARWTRLGVGLALIGLGILLVALAM